MNVISEIAALPVIAPPLRHAADRRLHQRRSGVRPPVATEEDRRDGRERRATPRLQVELDCEELIDGVRSFRVTRDLSVFGVSTRFGHPHRIGTRFELLLYLPDDRKNPLQLTVEVVAWNPSGAGMRLAFRNPSIEAVRRIQRFLRTRAS